MWCLHPGQVSSDEEETEEVEITAPLVPAELFTPPVSLSRSGGTAAFYGFRYVGDPRDSRFAGGRGTDYWIGKDLSRAADELRFYEQIATLDRQAFRLLHLWGMEYGGVVSARCCASGCSSSCRDGEEVVQPCLELEERQLLLLQNLRCNTQALRMLDIKLGEETAVAGWKGKSAHAATRNRMIDRMTNSWVQGFRLEGFDNQPFTLRSQATAPPQSCVQLQKRSRRFKLQRLRAQEFLAFFVDNSDLVAGDPTLPPSLDRLLPAEYSECVLYDAARQLAKLCADAAAMPVPQMWIGSSIALACEGGQLLERNTTFASLSRSEAHRSHVARIKVFDWGRSELNTPEADARRPPEERRMRSLYWQKWQRGALRVFYDCVCLYRRQFCGSFPGSGCEVCVQAWDYDTLDANDIIGLAVLPLAPTNGPITVRLRRVDGERKKLRAQVEIEILRLPLPAAGGTRLADAWRVIVHSVQNLPRMDVFSATDPLVVVQLRNPRCPSAPQAQTPVIWNNQNADFDTATLDFGTVVASTEAMLFAEISRALGAHVDAEMFKLASPDVDMQDGSAGDVLQDSGFEEFLEKVPCVRGLVRRGDDPGD